MYKSKRKRLKEQGRRTRRSSLPGMVQQLLVHRRDSYQGPKSPVFASHAGSPLRPKNVYRRVLVPAVIGAGFKIEVEINSEQRTRATVSFHAFLYTCANPLFEKGRNVKQVQAWLGHAPIRLHALDLHSSNRRRRRERCLLR